MGKNNRMGIKAPTQKISQYYSYYLEVLAASKNKDKSMYVQGNLHGLGLALNYSHQRIEEDITKAICDNSEITYVI